MNQDQGNYGSQQGEFGSFSWVCPKCHTINNAEICCCCGFKRKIYRRKNPWKIVSIILIVVLVLLILGIFSAGGSESDVDASQTAAVPAEVSVEASASANVETEESPCKSGHNFADATCTKPRTCKDCGETEGEALGHDYQPASCTQPSRCSRCLKSDGTALGHDWQEATYDAPETCSLCGTTRGTVKGYYEYLSGDYKSTTASVAGTVSRPWVFDEKVENCKEFTLHYQIVDIDYGKAYGKFSLYYKKSNGKWEKLGTFEVSDKSEVVKTFRFDDPISFKELAVVAPYRSSFSFSSRLWFDNWYLEE